MQKEKRISFTSAFLNWHNFAMCAQLEILHGLGFIGSIVLKSIKLYWVTFE